MTNAPHSRCTSQVSVVVTTPARVMLVRIHAIFGAEKYGSHTSPVRRASSSAWPLSAAQIDSARRSCHTIAGVSGPSGVAVPRQHGLALVGQGDGGDGNAGLGQRPASGGDHRVEQGIGVLLDPTPGQVPRTQPHLGEGGDPSYPAVPEIDDDGLGA